MSRFAWDFTRFENDLGVNTRLLIGENDPGVITQVGAHLFANSGIVVVMLL